MELDLALIDQLEPYVEDRELVRKLLEKDPEAENYFFNAYRAKLYRTCSHILGHQDPEAEDLAQEAMIVALRKLPEFEFRSGLNRWLFRICVFLCFERIRKRKKMVVQLEAELEDLALGFSANQEREKEEAAERQKKIDLIRGQRDRMGEPCQGLLRKWEEEGLSYARIAEEIRVPIGTVMSRLARCKEALKQLVLNAVQGGDHA